MTLKPYYQDDYATIYLGDCREILSSLPKADLVITDPPYGMEYQSAWRADWDRHDKVIGDEAFPLWIFKELTPTIAMFLWCRWDNLRELPPPKSFIVWDKCNHSMGDLKHEFGRQWEGCAFYPGSEHSFIYRPVDILRVPRISADKLEHPCEKPSRAITPLIKPHLSDLILDPFMGTGSTLVAAKDLQRKAIGIEISERYCEIAANRLRQEVLPLC